jgi:hypothetical protein
MQPKRLAFLPPPEPVYTIEICDCDKVFDQILNLSGATGLDVDLGSKRIRDASAPSKFPVYYNSNHNGQEVLFYVNTTFTPNIRYNCHMFFGNTFNNMVEKMFAVSDLIKYNGSPKNAGINTAYLVGSDIVLSFYDVGTSKNWPVFKYKPGGTSLPMLTDIDHPNLPVVWSGNCYYNYTGPGGPGGPGGPPEPGSPIPPIEYEEITGPSGTDGEDGDDGGYPDEFYELDMAPLIKPHDNGAETMNNDPGIVTVLTKISSTGDNNQVYVVINDKKTGKVNYKVHTVTGATIEEGSFENFVSLSHLASGVYLVRIESGTKQEVKKVVIP